MPLWLQAQLASYIIPKVVDYLTGLIGPNDKKRLRALHDILCYVDKHGGLKGRNKIAIAKCCVMVKELK